MDALQNWRAYLPARERLYEPLTLLLIALLILGIMSLVLFSLLPQARARGALQSQTISLEQAVALEKTVQAEAPTRVVGQINLAETQVANAAAQLLSEAEANIVLNRLYQYARTSGVTIVDLKAQSTPNLTPTAIVRVLRFNLQVEGTLPRLLNFLARIEETARPGFSLTNVAIQAEQRVHIAYMDLALHISPYAVSDGEAGAPPTALPLGEITATATAVTTDATPTPGPTASPAPAEPLPLLPTVPIISPSSFPIQAGCPNLVQNGGFEEPAGWLFGPSITPPRYTTSQRQAGLQAMQLGILPDTGTIGRSSYSSIRQRITIPPTASRVILYWWQWAGTEEAVTAVLNSNDDRQEVLLLTDEEEVLAVVQQRQQRDNGWQHYGADLTNYRGQSVYLHVTVFNNENDLSSWLYLDEVVLQACDPFVTPNATATPVPTATLAPVTATPVPTATFLPATATPIFPTATPPGSTATPTTVADCTNFLGNGGFEEAGSWQLGQSSAPPQYVTGQQQAGARAMQLGRLPGGSDGRSSYSSIRQLITIPAGAQQVTLRWWQWAGTEESPTTTPASNSDRQELLLLAPDERVRTVIQRTRLNTGGWQEQSADITAYRGQTVYVYFNVFNDSNSAATWLYVDEVALSIDCVATPVPTATPIVATATSTPIVATATSTPIVATATSTPIVATSTPTSIVATATPTNIADCTDLVGNGDFEADASWIVGRTASTAAYTTDQQYRGSRSMQLGIPVSTSNTQGYSSIRQSVTLPDSAGALTLRWWQWAGTEEGNASDPGTATDRQEVLLLTPDEQILTVISRIRQTTGGWQENSADLTAYRGRTVSLYFNVVNDGVGGRTWMYVDGVELLNCSVAAVVPTVTGTPLPFADVVISDIKRG